MNKAELESYLYYSPFSCSEFCYSIDKYLNFDYIPCQVKFKDKEYTINLFKNDNNEYQIGVIGYGAIFPFPDTGEKFKELIDYIINNYGKLVKITLPPFLKVSNEFLEKLSSEYEITTLETAILDLDQYRHISDSMFKGSVRTDINYSINHNIIVKKCTLKEEIDEFYIFYKETMDRVGSTYYTPKEMMINLILEEKNAYLLLAKLKNKIVAGSIFLENKNHVFYWINASIYKYRHLRGNYLILKEAIDKSSLEGKKFFNFGYSHNENIRKTKLGWGCNLQRYFTLIKK